MLSKQEFETILTNLPRQRKDILFRLLRGETDGQIATALAIHQGTVRKQISNLALDFGLGNDGKQKRTDLVTLVAKHQPELLFQKAPYIDLMSDHKANRNDLFKATARINPKMATETNPEKVEEILIGAQIVDNPFYLGSGAIDESWFYHRDKDVDHIFGCLNGLGNIALFGESGIGKSSLLREVIRQSKNRLECPREPIFMNLCFVRSEDDFYEYLCGELEIETCKGYALVEVIKDIGGILLVLDEIGALTYGDFKRIHGELAGFTDQSFMQLLTASIYPLSEMFSGKPGIHRFQEYKINGWDKITIRSMICDRLNSPVLNPEYKSITFSEDEIKEIITVSNGNPQKLMRLCHFLFEDKKDVLDS